LPTIAPTEFPTSSPTTEGEKFRCTNNQGTGGFCATDCGGGDPYFDCQTTCQAYGIPFEGVEQCSAQGGGGKECPPTFICCSCQPAINDFFI
jgi:hypothetical protein